MQLQRYHYYISNGIDTEHVAPMEDSWLQHIMSLVKEPLKKHEETIENLCDEIKEDYLMSVKKAIVDFVLNDPMSKEEEGRPKTASELSARIKSANKLDLTQMDAESDLTATNPSDLVVYSPVPDYIKE